MGKRIKQKNEKKGENKKKPGIQRVLHLSYDRTDSRRKCPTQCHSRNRDHRVQHRRPRLDDVLTTVTTSARRYHLLVSTVLPGTQLSITRFERCRFTRRRNERNKIEANSRTVHDLHVERLSYLHSSFRSKVTPPFFGSATERRILAIFILKIVRRARSLCTLFTAVSISHM